MKKNILISIFLLIAFYGFTESSVQKHLKQEYERIYKRIKYSQLSGFCFDGNKKISEIKEKGNENSFFVKEENIYLKVYNKKADKFFYSRHFEFKSIFGKLMLEEDYQIEPAIRVNEHWSFFQTGNKINITLCDKNTCKNFAINLYEINAKATNIQDAVFFEFKDEDINIAKSFKLIKNSKGVPNINLETEKKEMQKILKKMSKHFKAQEINKKKKDFENLIKNLK